MSDDQKTKKELLAELEDCRRKVRELEKIAFDPLDIGVCGGSETVLIVEDDDLVRDAVNRMLRLYSYNVLTAAGAEEALAICREHQGHIDLVLTDIMMPGLSGKDLSERLQIMIPGVKVVYMTGFANSEIVPNDVYDIMDGGSSIISKPFTAESLVKKIRQELDD